MKKSSIKFRDPFSLAIKIDLFLILILVAIFIYQFLPKNNDNNTASLPKKINQKVINDLINPQTKEPQIKISPF